MKSWFYKIGLSLLCLLGCGWTWAERTPQDPFLVEYNPEALQVLPGKSFTFTLRIKIPSGFYLYEEKTSLLFDKTADLLLLKSERPPATLHVDPFLKKEAPVYFNDFEQKVSFMVPQETAPGLYVLEATLRYQGCSADLCYRPMRRTLSLPVQVAAPGETIQAPPSETGAQWKALPPSHAREAKPSFWSLLHESNPELLLDQGKVVLLGLALFGGILTSFTPCVLPIVPLTLAFIGVKPSRRGNWRRVLLLVLGMVVMYSLLGFLAALLGLKLGFLFQSRWFLLLTALFFLIFALGLFGVIPFQLPSSWQSRLAKTGGAGALGAFLAGLTTGLIAAPCVGPLIAPLLLIAARAQDKIYGFLLLLNYGLGMGLLFLLVGTGFMELTIRLRGGIWPQVLKKSLGVLLLVPALFYGSLFAKPLLSETQDAFWEFDLEKGLSQAARSRKPMVLDFYADWCPPCHELDKLTFSAPAVRRLAEQFVMVKVDCTTDNAQCRSATARYQVVGWPTVLFFNSRGEPIPDLKLVGGFTGPERMLTLMKAALSRNQE
ncbi:MAG TPA: hypothetical protein DF383_04620 [Deltaproteobacteria bacterium]|nr:hypothetical protein [Deltaproteobacteria bacterium]